MRLIDADAIKLEKGFFENIDNVPKFFEWLGKQPTIDPVKHGKWIPYEFGDETWHKCSECNVADQYGYRYTAFDGKEHVFFSIRTYCPNCGALMREDGGEG